MTFPKNNNFTAVCLCTSVDRGRIIVVQNTFIGLSCERGGVVRWCHTIGFCLEYICHHWAIMCQFSWFKNFPNFCSAHYYISVVNINMVYLIPVSWEEQFYLGVRGKNITFLGPKVKNAICEGTPPPTYTQTVVSVRAQWCRDAKCLNLI